MNMKSNVCRAEIGYNVFKDVKTAGIHPAPEGMQYRQVKLLEDHNVLRVPAKMKKHRGEWIPVMSRSDADSLISFGVATPVKQSLLFYTIEDYVNDNDVKNDAEELARAKKHQSLFPECVVLVAVISDIGRSALAVARNVVSGCQNMDELKSDCDKALQASSCILVED